VDDLLVRVRTGVIDATSFAFLADDLDPDQVHWDRSEVKDGKLPLRELLSANRIFDVSPVVFAAYDNTSVGLRSAESVFNDHIQSLEGQVPEGDDDAEREGLELDRARAIVEVLKLKQ
jgi:phage head maturation protease